MPITFPRESQAGSQRPSRLADLIYEHVIWMARWSNEIVSDSDIDMKKLGQLAYGPQSHCAQFLALIKDGPDDLFDAVVERFRKEGLTVTKAQMLSVRQRAQALLDAMSAAPELTLETRVWTSAGERTDTVKVAKTHPAMPLVQALRAEFT